MKFKKVFLTALCCAMAVTAFAACEKDGEGSKKPTQQNPSAQTPSTPQTPDMPVVKTVTQEQWTQIFASIQSVNNVMVGLTQTSEVEGQTSTMTYVLKIAGDKMYQKESYNGGSEGEVYFANEDGTEYRYTQNANGEWEKEPYQNAFTHDLSVIDYVFEAVQPMFAQLSFDEATGVYAGTNVEWEEGIFSFVSVGFVNGKLASISLRMENDNLQSYTFSGYGTTKITLPDEEEEGGNEGGDVLPPDGQEWSEEDWALALSNLLNTTSGTMEINYYLYENGTPLEYSYEQRTVENGTKVREYCYWEDEDGSSERSRFYENVKGTHYIYEYTNDAWEKSERSSGSYDFTEFENTWYYERGVLPSVPYLESNGKGYYAEDFYFDNGEDVNFDDITIIVEDAKITYIEINCHNPDWEETIVIEVDYENATVELPYVSGGDEEVGTVSDFIVTDTDGDVFQLSQALKENDLVLINFWATWCGPCKAETPVLQVIVDEYAGRLAFIGISVTDTDEEINAYRDAQALTLNMVSGSEGADLISSYLGGEIAVPHTFIVNSNMEIVFDHLGLIESLADWREIIDCLLAGKEAPEVGGDDEEQDYYSFLVRAYYGTPLTGYQVLLSIDGVEFPSTTVDENGWAYFYPSQYGCGAAEYQISLLDEYGDYVKFDGAQYTEDYGEYWLYVDLGSEMPEEGDDEVVVDPEVEAAWNEAFKNTLSSTDFTVECEQNTPDGEGYGMYQVDDGCKAYERTQYCYLGTSEEYYNETYYERLGSYDYVYAYDYDANEYVYSETTVGDEVYSMSAPGGDLLSMLQSMFNVMEYQGNDFFLMNEDYMNSSFKVFDQMDRIEVVFMDGYVNAVRFYGYDADGNWCYITYMFYAYGETEIYMPQVAEPSEVPDNDYITNH